jgi:putative ABC transport system permease protein
MERYEQAREELAVAEQELAEGKAALDEGYALAAEGEQQLSDAKAQLDAGYAQLAEAEQQLSDAERELAEGRKALDEGYARLAEGGRQIAEGRAEAAEAEQQLSEGRKTLDESRQKLEEGRQTLRENLADINGSLAKLDEVENEKERLARGILLLQTEEGVKEHLGRKAGVMDVLAAAERYSASLLEEEEGGRYRAAEYGLILAAACALLGTILSLGKKAPSLPSAALCALGALLGLLALLYRLLRGPGTDLLFLAAAAALTVFAAVFSEILFRRSREAYGRSGPQAAG